MALIKPLRSGSGKLWTHFSSSEKKPGKKSQSNLITSLMTCIVKTQKYQVKQTQKTGVTTQETCDC